MRIRQLNHSVYQIQYHLVWGSKYRRKILKPYVRTELIKSLYKLQKRYPDWYFHSLNAGADHVHMLVEIPPKYRLSEVVQKLKIASNNDLRKRFKFIRQIYSKRQSIWSVGYFVSTVGLNEEQIRSYIAMQNRDDQGRDVSTEFE